MSSPTFDFNVDRLRQDFDKLVEAVWSQGGKAADAFGLKNRGWAPEVDVVELTDSLQVTVDLPGMSGEDVEVLLTGNMLTVKGDRTPPVVAPQDIAHRRERHFGKFERMIPLPAPVIPTQVVAEARHGVLVITLTKEAPIQPPVVRVPVRPEGSSFPTPSM